MELRLSPKHATLRFRLQTMLHSFNSVALSWKARWIMHRCRHMLGTKVSRQGCKSSQHAFRSEYSVGYAGQIHHYEF